MKIRLFENFDKIDLDVTYEIYEIDKNGDEEPFNSGFDDYDFNPYNLKEVVDCYIKYKNKHKLIIKKITSETLDEETIKLLVDSKKFNL